ncbi:MAG: RNA methyltransferase [Flavobacteriales bacterium]|nr:RNA methyltransferase [Flavobacteriales bacterium]
MSDLLEYLLSFTTENKRELIASRLLERTRHLTLVLEDIYHSPNANAVIRTADCFGIQDVHVIEGRNVYDFNPRVVKGSLKWIELHRYAHHQNNTEACINRLKTKGFTIVATSPHGDSIPLQELPIDKPIALLFGGEKNGLSKTALAMADINMHIPMYGFTESLNVSVSAAISVQHLTQRFRDSEVAWQLTEEEHNELCFQWVRTVLKDPDGLEKRFLSGK